MTGAPWYETFKNNVREEMNPHTYGNKMKMKYVAICSCGDMSASSNKDGLQHHISSHQFGSYGEHRVQMFKETDIW